MQVADLQKVLEARAPAELAQPWDNCGLLAGDQRAPVREVLAALELTGAVVDEAIATGCDTVITHHPLLFSPVRSLVESHPREQMLRRLVEHHMALIACHTNLDAAPGGLAEIAGEALGLQGMVPLEPASAGWYKLVGFVPPEAVESVATAVFGAGAGGIGNYRECAFTAAGTGWFTAMPGSHPAVGEVARPERTQEVRWETVVPRGRVNEAIRAFVTAHPYEEPAFDLYPVDDVLPGVGLGRVGTLGEAVAVRVLAERVVEVFGVGRVAWSGDGARLVTRVGVLPGSGRGLMEVAAGRCEVLITGDMSHHSAEDAAERGLSLIDVPHGDFEWWAFRLWSERLAQELSASGVKVLVSSEWRSPWHEVASSGCCGEKGGGQVRMWIDGGSRGNPGPSAIGVILEDADGTVLGTVSQTIGVGTNNVAEYRALLAGLEAAAGMGATDVEVASDSELLVKQMRGEYKVKNEGLKSLHDEARRKANGFGQFVIRHIPREENSRADALVNRALDEDEGAGL